MARKTNFGFEKRQKELAKKAKKEEKAKRKQEEKDAEALVSDGSADPEPDSI